MKINDSKIVDGLSPDGSYQDRIDVSGQERAGTEITASVFNQIIKEIQENYILKAGINPDSDDLGQFYKATEYFVSKWLDPVLSRITSNDTDINSLRWAVPNPIILEKKMIFSNLPEIETPHGDYFLLNGQTIDISLYPEARTALINMGFIGSTAELINLADYRGMYPRMAGVGATGETGNRTKKWAAGNTNYNSVGTVQSDAIKNITGYFSSNAPNRYEHSISGVFHSVYNLSRGGTSVSNGVYGIGFNASRVVPTAATNHPHNFTTNFYIYLGTQSL